jgi:hypothetical protein
MNQIFFVPFFLQGLLISIDEFYFHRRRSLPRWERLSHPIDTFFILLCYFYLLSGPAVNEKIYLVLATISSLSVTKDEFVHQKNCQAGEMWLHALLFIIHPLTLLCAFYLPRPALLVSFSLVFTFFIYQIWYWNFFRVKHEYQ